MESTVLIYTSQRSSRLLYVLDWLFKEQLKVSYTLTDNEAQAAAQHFFISYGKSFSNSLSIPDAGLLWEKDVKEHEINTGEWKQIPTLYHKEAGYTLPFDIFSAIFFLLSRYEEYYPYTADKYDRYPATESILCKNDWLECPLVDEWVQELRILLQQQLNVHPGSFSFQPTYDIDMAYAYRHKTITRTAGGFVRDAVKGKIADVVTRAKVLAGAEKDPFDCFDNLQQLHEKLELQPKWFILTAQQTTTLDKNTSPHHPTMQQLIGKLAARDEIGLHPSYFSHKGETMKQEKQLLSALAHKPITISRQHYIRNKMPDAYRRLIENGIAEDWSMGYGSHTGFRAGTGRSFLWYDLSEEKTTVLRIYPFCFMDATAMYHEHMNAETAFQKLEEITAVLKRVNSTLVTVFHNFSLGSSKEWKGWSEHYERFCAGLR